MGPQLDHLRKFVAPEVVFGAGSRWLTGRSAAKQGATHALVVTDPGVVAAGWAAGVISSLEAAGIAWTMFSNVSENPRSEEVMLGQEQYARHGCDAIVSVGGGSVTDCAKGIGIVSANDDDILCFEGADQVANAIPPLICVPTTGGSSADVSQFAMITDMASHRKIPIISKSVVPDVSLIDPETLTTMDSYLTACTGVDAIVHSIEAFLSLSSSPLTDAHALNGLQLLSENLEASIQDPSNVELRSKLMLGGLQAGLAFSNASLGANHAMAHSLGGLFDLSHGECNAIILSHVVEFNYETTPERCKQVGHAMGLELGGLNTSECKRALVKSIRELCQRVGIGKTLAQTGVHSSDIPLLAEHAIADVCMATNPRRARRRDIEVIYEESI